MNEIERQVATHDVEIAIMKESMADLKKDVKELLAIANQSKGGWKTLMLVGSMSGAVGAVIGKFLPFFK